MQRAFLLVLFLSLFPFSSSNDQYDALENIVGAWKLNRSKWERTETCKPVNNWIKENDDFFIKCACVPNNNTSNCSITELKVYGRNVTGNIHEALLNLTDLTHLNLSHNLLSGSIPSNITRLMKLEQLDLRVNKLSGSISALSNLKKLTYLGLSANMLSGDLSQLENLISLEHLYIDSNKFNGKLGLEKLINLMTLWAFDNNFTGDFAASLRNHRHLTDLRIYGTSLQSDTLQRLSSLNKLVTLILGDLGGNVRELSFLNMTNLSFLSLRNSNVTGNWTNYLDTLKKLANLKYLDLSFNELTGSITLSDGFNSLRHLILGNNNLSGEYPIHPNLTTLDVSFNNIKGTFSSSNNLSINYLGTSITSNKTNNTRDKGLLSCPNMSSCTNNSFIFLNSSFAVNCGGKEVSNSGIIFRSDTDPLGAANFSIDLPNHQWAVSNVGYSGSPSNNPFGIVSTNKSVSIDGDESSMLSLYQTARVSTSSLRYYLGGLENGNYSIDLHFAEIVISDNKSSWECLGRRVFDIYIQKDRRQQDFNIIDEAQGSFKALKKNFIAEVTNYVLEIHLFWAGKGTFGIPHDYTYGPLLSAINISRVEKDNVQPASNYTKRKTKRAGIVTGIAAICAATLLILLSIGYLWWKRINLGHIRLTDSAMKG